MRFLGQQGVVQKSNGPSRDGGAYRNTGPRPSLPRARRVTGAQKEPDGLLMEKTKWGDGCRHGACRGVCALQPAGSRRATLQRSS